MSEENKKRLPVFKTDRIGSVDGAVWQNDSEKGSFFSITTQRHYKTQGDNGEWKTTNSLRASDVKDMQIVLEKCYDYIRIGSKKQG